MSGMSGDNSKSRLGAGTPYTPGATATLFVPDTYYYPGPPVRRLNWVALNGREQTASGQLALDHMAGAGWVASDGADTLWLSNAGGGVTQVQVSAGSYATKDIDVPNGSGPLVVGSYGKVYVGPFTSEPAQTEYFLSRIDSTRATLDPFAQPAAVAPGVPGAVCWSLCAYNDFLISLGGVMGQWGATGYVVVRNQSDGRRLSTTEVPGAVAMASAVGAPTICVASRTGSGNSVSAYSVDSAGNLTLRGNAVSLNDEPAGVAVSRDGSYAYVTLANGTVARVSTTGTGDPTYISVTPPSGMSDAKAVGPVLIPPYDYAFVLMLSPSAPPNACVMVAALDLANPSQGPVGYFSGGGGNGLALLRTPPK